MKKFAGRLSAVIFGLTLSWLLIEFIFRIAFPIFPYGIQIPMRYVKKHPFTQERILPPVANQPEATYQMVLQPNLDNVPQFPNPNVTYQLSTKNWLDPSSNVGFRVPSIDWEPTWPIDGVVVGDSFSFCFNEYEDCWVRQLETEHGLSMVNLGQGATGSISHKNIYTTFGQPYEPRFVIWQWYGNDANEDFGFAGRDLLAEEVSEGSNSPSTFEQSAVGVWLQDNSAFYWILKSVFGTHENQAGFDAQTDPFFTEVDEKIMFYGRTYSYKSADLSQEKNQIGQELGEEAILQTRDLLAEQNIPLLIVLVPFKEEIYAELTQTELGDDTMIAMSSARERMLEFCAENYLPCLDPSDQLTAAANNDELIYWEKDTHFNAAGNDIFTEAVWTFLQEAGVVAGR